MADAPAPGGGSKLDSNAAIQKYASITQAGAGSDAAVITRVENGIKNSPMGWLEHLMAETDSRAAQAKSQAQGKLAEQQNAIASQQKQAPKDAGVPPVPAHPAAPAIAHPAVAGQHATTAPTHAAPAGGAAAPAHAAQVTAPAKTSTSAPPAPANESHTVASAIAGAGNDAQLDSVLNAYSPKSQAAPEMLGRIKQMGDVANSFNGSLDTYIAQSGAVENAIAASSNALGVGKATAAIWQQNPYRKVGGILGGIMTGLGVVKGVCGVVGSVCGKLGMFLTVVGLFGMIFPPIGVAVEGIARILNAIGLICDAISLVTSGILTGLNGVVLAQQINSGASAEEKAATADMMMQEANDAASSIISVAMVFGDGFAKGLTRATSKGPLGAFVRGAKAKVGIITQKISGNVKLYANKMVRSMGFGGADAARVGGKWVEQGLVAKGIGAFKSAPKVIDKVQDWTMHKIGDSKLAKGLDRVGAWSGSVASKLDIEDKIVKAGEKTGSAVGRAGAETNLGKSMTKGAENAEHDLRVTEMRNQVRDAQQLEEARWNRYVDQKTKANPEYRAVSAQTQMKKEQGKIAADAETKLASREQNIELRDKLENETGPARVEQKQDRYLANEKSPNAGGKNTRDDFMDRLHNSRSERYRIEEQYAPQLEKRDALLAKENLSARDKANLTKLNSQLDGVERARAANEFQEHELERLSTGDVSPKKEEFSNWKDVTDKVWETSEGPRELMGLKAEDAGWAKTEKFNLSKATTFDKGAAKAGAASAGGQGQFAAIDAFSRQQNEAQIRSFVRAAPRKANVADTVRGMLANIASGPGGGKSPVTVVNAAANTPKAGPAANNVTTTPNAAAPNHGAGAGEVVAHEAVRANDGAPTAPNGPGAAAPANEAKAAGPDAGGSEPLPYWPSLMPEFDKAQHDFGYMRKVAVEYRKVQIEGKQKAVDALAVYGKYQEYAKLRQAAAVHNQQQSQTAGSQIQQNVTHSTTSEQQAGQGEAKQEQGKSAANDRAAVELPEPEARSFWDRILGAVKRWAKAAAQAVFGWIQEQIASLVLKGLCNVSMGDLREYAGALKREQQAAHGVAGTAAQTSAAAGEKHIQLQGKASKEAQSAADTIGDCDSGIVEADGFLADITSMESQLADEKAYAQDFLAKISAEAQAMRAAQGQGAGGPTAGATPNGPHENEPANGQGQPQEQPVLQAVHEGEVKAAAGYVGQTGDNMVAQLETRQENYQNDLALAMVNRKGDLLKDAAHQGGKKTVEEFKEFTTHLKANMDLGLGQMTDASMAGQIANQVIMAAGNLEMRFEESEQDLDHLYEVAYQQIEGSTHTLKDRIFNGNNPIGRMNHEGEGMAAGTVNVALGHHDDSSSVA